jgi:hypothetical protein
MNEYCEIMIEQRVDGDIYSAWCLNCNQGLHESNRREEVEYEAEHHACPYAFERGAYNWAPVQRESSF